MDARFPTEAGRDVVLGLGTCVYAQTTCIRAAQDRRQKMKQVLDLTFDPSNEEDPVQYP